MEKVFAITNGNEVLDILIGEQKRQIAENTRDFIIKGNQEEAWLDTYIVELNAEGELHEGKINILTLITLNNEPHLAIINEIINVVERIEDIKNKETEYRHYNVETYWIDEKGNIIWQ